ncbi:hypothetical protein NCS52_00987600 [Fusarium sp. LHS14.1]|nr:hypothetical protein NCS52_00987600 [Fusarium sp. LHS14.1]
MVRSVSRSRGCSRCLQRKIKCDELQPVCSPCGRLKKPCPGVYKGVFLVHAARGSYHVTNHTKIASNNEEGKLPTQPSEQPLFEQSTIATFITCFSTSLKPGRVYTQSWTQYLSSWISFSTTTWSVRAVTLLFYGQNTRQEDLCREADRCYARALKTQRGRIKRQITRSKETEDMSTEIPSEQDISASLMLMYYELLSPSFVGSWMTHFKACCQLLVLRGPENCQDGPCHVMFRSLRLIMAHVSTRTASGACFNTKDWYTVPFAKSTKAATDILIDIIYDVSKLQIAVSAEDEETERLLSPLEALLDAVAYSEQLYARESRTTFHFDQVELAEEEFWLSGGDFCSTTLESAFYAVRIMIYHLILKRRPSTDLVVESIVRCASLLTFADALFTRNLHNRLNTGSCVQMVFPLEMVSWYSPCPHQRQKARNTLEHLGWVQSASE